MRKRIVAVLMSFALAFSLMAPMAAPQVAAAATPPTIGAVNQTVSTEAGLLSAVAAAPTNGTQYVIAVSGTIPLTATVTIPAGANIALTGGGTLSGAGNFTDIDVNGGLILSNIKVTHAAGMIGQGVHINTSGRLDMLEGAIVSGNTNTAYGTGAIVNFGIFTMWDGEITNNTMTASVGSGGVFNEGQFTMNGGGITNNTGLSGAGVANGDSSFSSNAEFIMNGGVISDNTATTGGGVVSYAPFTMNDGTISNNKSTASGGGGVRLWSSATMNGGTISGNTGTSGGGVYVNGNTRAVTFTMTGGVITGNTAVTTSGGGVYVASWNAGTGAFVMSGGTIASNVATVNGGGICNNATAAVNAPITITGGSITSNIATVDGGGIYTGDYAQLTVGAAAVFSGNSAATLYPDRDPALDAVYATNILGTQWTVPLTQGYTNYDINANYGTPRSIQQVTVLNDGNGTASADATVVLDGDTVTLTAAPKPGYVFDHWTVDAGGATLSSLTDPNATFTMPSSDVTVTAHFLNTPPVINISRDVIYVQEGVTLTLADILRIAGVSITDAEETIPLSALSVSGYSGIKWSVVNFPGEGYVLTLDVSDTPGLEAATRQIAIFVQPKDTPIKPNPDPDLPDLPDGLNWGTDPLGNPIIYIPAATPKPLALPKASGLPLTGDRSSAASASGLAVLGALAAAALLLRRRRLTS